MQTQLKEISAVFLLTSREVNWLSLQYNIVSAVFLLTSREVNSLMLQFNSVNAVFLLTSREVNRFALHSNIVSAVFLLTSREVNLLKQQFNLVNAVFSLTSSAVSWLSVHRKIFNDVKYSMPFRLVIPLLEQLIFLTAAISVSLKLLSWLVSNFLTTVRKFASGKLVLSIATPALWTAMPFSPSPLSCARAASDCVSGISLSWFS